MAEVFVGLGSNIEPEANLDAAIERLERALGPLRRSATYRSPPHGFRGPDFLNLVVAFESTAGPAEVEGVLSAIERTAGRRRADRDGSRTLDLDLLLYGSRVDAALRLPREDVLLYPFVLAPLADLAPALRHPVTGVAIGAAWRRMARERPALARLGEARPVPGAAVTSRRCAPRRRR